MGNLNIILFPGRMRKGVQRGQRRNKTAEIGEKKRVENRPAKKSLISSKTSGA